MHAQRNELLGDPESAKAPASPKTAHGENAFCNKTVSTQNQKRTSDGEPWAEQHQRIRKCKIANSVDIPKKSSQK